MNPDIVRHFINVDPMLGDYVQTVTSLKLPTKSTDLTLRLMRSIASQQLSVKAAATIWSRVLELFDPTNPTSVIGVHEDALRTAGLSYQKARYLHAIAAADRDGLVVFSQLDQLSDEEIITKLTAIKGVGKWTAEMFLIFAVARPDVFSGGDLGLINAMKKLYNVPNLTKEEALKISQKWTPYRSAASLLLWHSLDNKV